MGTDVVRALVFWPLLDQLLFQTGRPVYFCSFKEHFGLIFVVLLLSGFSETGELNSPGCPELRLSSSEVSIKAVEGSLEIVKG